MAKQMSRKIINNKTIHEGNLNSAVFNTRRLLYQFNKYTIFANVLVFIYLFMHDISFETIMNDWISTLWNMAIGVSYLGSAWMVSKVVLDSSRKSRTGILFVGFLIAYGIYLYLVEADREVTDLNDFDYLAILWAIPPLIRILDRLIMIVLNWRISPLESRYNVPKLIGFTLMSAGSILLYVIMDLVIRGSKVDPDYVFVEAIKDGGIESIGISMTVISLVTGFFLYTTWKRKLKKVVFASWSNEKVKVTTIPAYIALVIWFVRNAIHWELVGKEEWYVIGIEIFLVVVGIAYSFAKSDVSSRNIAVMVFWNINNTNLNDSIHIQPNIQY